LKNTAKEHRNDNYLADINCTLS